MNTAGKSEPAIVDRRVVEEVAWGRGCSAWTLVSRPELLVKHERLPVGSAEELHVHDRARQFFLVLAGCAVLTVAGSPHELSAGQGLEVPPGTAHLLRAAGSAPVEVLVISGPSTDGDRRRPEAACA